MRCAVVGDPAGHSLSPAIHRAGYAAHGMDWSYEACTVTADDFAAWVRARSEDPEWAGLSVTAPHKEALLQLGEPDEPAQLVGAGNTIVFGERDRVYNTDIRGFVVAANAAGMRAPSSACIVGAGATARSALVALASMGLQRVHVEARNPDRAAHLLELAATLAIPATVSTLGSGSEDHDVLVNTVPVSATEPHAEAWVRRSGTVFDVVYDPWPTPLGAAAAAADRPALNGLDLLAGQAVDQFFLLTGATVTFAQCRSAAEQELGRRRGV